MYNGASPTPGTDATVIEDPAGACSNAPEEPDPGSWQPASSTADATVQLATIQAPEARLAVITPYDKSSLGAIEKAIRDSDLGVNPSNDGNVIRLAFPQLTEERRREYIKVARSKAEDARISVRNIRRHAKEAIDKLIKDGEVGEDEGKRAEKELDGFTAKHTGQIDEALKHKENELLEV